METAQITSLSVAPRVATVVQVRALWALDDIWDTRARMLAALDAGQTVVATMPITWALWETRATARELAALGECSAEVRERYIENAGSLTGFTLRYEIVLNRAGE